MFLDDSMKRDDDKKSPRLWEPRAKAVSKEHVL
jgi:hypothetical protein